MTEAATRSCSMKEVFLNISRNSQETTCDVVSFLTKFPILDPLFYY